MDLLKEEMVIEANNKHSSIENLMCSLVVGVYNSELIALHILLV